MDSEAEIREALCQLIGAVRGLVKYEPELPKRLGDRLMTHVERADAALETTRAGYIGNWVKQSAAE